MNGLSLGFGKNASMRLCRKVTLGLVFVAMGVGAWAQPGTGCPAHKSLTLALVVGYIEQKVSEERTVQRIESCGVGFPVDVQALDQLTNSGASQNVVDALNKASTSDLTLDAARSQVTMLESRIGQIDSAVNADRDAALRDQNLVYQADRAKAAHIDPKSEFQSTADYEVIKQKNRALLSEMDKKQEADRKRITADYAEKAERKEKLYRNRIVFLEASTYPDARAIMYSSYNADSQKLSAVLDGEPYEFDAVPGATAQTLVKNWAKVKVTQRFTEDRMRTRFLELGTVSVRVSGHSVKAEQDTIVEDHLERGRVFVGKHQFDAAMAEFQAAQKLDPNNSEAKDGITKLVSFLKGVTEFVNGLPPNGIWLDKQTQLMWTTKKSEHMLNWKGANDYCQTMAIGGLSEWRLPTKDELKGIYSPSATKTKRSTVPGESTFANMKGPIDVTGMVVFIWSSTTTNNGGAYEAWFDMGQIDVAPLDRKVDRHALCVRQYQPDADGVDMTLLAGISQESTTNRPSNGEDGNSSTPPVTNLVSETASPADTYFKKGQALAAQAMVDTRTGKVTLPPGCEDALRKYLELAPDGQYAKAAKSILESAQESRPTQPVASVKASQAGKVNISSGVAQGLLLQRISPIYPPIAKAAGVKGTVVLQVSISTSGSVESEKVISGPAFLLQAALDAVKQWRYRPYLLNNQPVQVDTTVNVTFDLKQ